MFPARCCPAIDLFIPNGKLWAEPITRGGKIEGVLVPPGFRSVEDLTGRRDTSVPVHGASGEVCAS
jgi:hypothetical protein